MKAICSLRLNYNYSRIVRKFNFCSSPIQKPSKISLLQRNWLDFLHNSSSNPNKKAYMDISSNRKQSSLNDLKTQLKDKSLINPFTSQKEINFNLFEIHEGRAKIMLANKGSEYDPEAKHDFFTHYNIVSVIFLIKK